MVLASISTLTALLVGSLSSRVTVPVPLPNWPLTSLTIMCLTENDAALFAGSISHSPARAAGAVAATATRARATRLMGCSYVEDESRWEKFRVLFSSPSRQAPGQTKSYFH